MVDVVVKESKIHRKGVFATRDFKKGELVIDWSTCSTQLTREQVEKLSDTERKYVSLLKDDKYVLFKSPARYVNHSCDSNTKAKGGCDIAVRDIKEGEEVTADYVLEKVPGLHLKCNCGSKNCRGIIKIDP